MDSRSYSFEGTDPEIHENARVSREATLVGDVTVGGAASVWPGAVLRGDVAPVTIGEGAHVGDNAVFHASTVGAGTMVGHCAVLNEATVGEGVVIGSNATLNPGATVGDDSIVGSGAVVPDDHQIPPESFARGAPAHVTPLAETDLDPDAIFEAYSSGEYTDLAARHGELFL